MTEDKESLLESFQEVNPDSAAQTGAPDAPAEPVGEPIPEEALGDLGSVADALLQASGTEGEAPLDLSGIPDSLPGDSVLSDVLADSPLPDLPAPDENPNAAIAVEEMLSAAVLDEAVAGAVAALPSEAAAQPSFQLKIQMDRTSSRDELKKIAAELGLNVADGAWASETPMISQLTEFQAIAFHQRLKALGWSAAIEVKRPGAVPTEEDLALGELSQVAEVPAVKAEGAPAVKLPGNEKSVLLYTAEELPAFPVQQTLGVVSAHRSLARRFFRDDELNQKMKKEIEKVPGRSASNLPKSHLEVIFRELFLDLQRAALSQGGNAVLGIKLDSFPESASLDPGLQQMRLVAFGTAAVVEKWDP